MRIACSGGLEEAVARELRSHGVEPGEAGRGAVRCRASPQRAAALTLGLRAATRVVAEIASELPADGEGLGDALRRLAWEDWLTARSSFAVRARGTSPALRHEAHSARLAKDAVVDRFRARGKTPPPVDPRRPGVLVELRVGPRAASAGLDLGGRSLHARGRGRRARAPLREDVAAGLALLAGARADRPLVDPFCGSGTLVVEAAAVALRRPPGGRDPSAMPIARLPAFASVALGGVAQELAERERPGAAPFLAFDDDPRAVREAREHVALSGLAGRIDVRRGRAPGLDLPDLAGPGLVLTNPPWGRRLADAAADAWRALGTLARRRELAGWTLAALSGDPRLTRHLGLAASRRWPLLVSGVDARLCVYALRGRGAD